MHVKNMPFRRLILVELENKLNHIIYIWCTQEDSNLQPSDP